MKQKLRKIVVDGTSYRWRVRHVHEPKVGPPGYRCTEVLTVFREGHPRGPARVRFVASEGVLVGDPRSGVVELGRGDWRVFNLNRPGLIARLIRTFEGWEPDARRSPWVVDDGVERLRALVV